MAIFVPAPRDRGHGWRAACLAMKKRIEVSAVCELMGMSFDDPTPAAISIRAFGQRGVENADGWGIGWYPDQSLSLVKEPTHWGASDHSQFLESYNLLSSAIYVAHVRHRTTGGAPTHADTHPFGREWRGRDYCFAHNGTLREFASRLPIDRFRPVGHTDSEHLFCWLMGRLARDDLELDDALAWAALNSLLRDANQLGRLNCLLTDGRRLFAYRDLRGWKGLFQVQTRRRSVRRRQRLGDENVRIELDSDGKTRGVIVATAPLSNDDWQPVAPGQLLVMERGEIAWAGPAEGAVAKGALPAGGAGGGAPSPSNSSRNRA
jgi:predicted glutamine amidotransferase